MIAGEKTISPVSRHIDTADYVVTPTYIGISDPCNDTVTSLCQAVERALALYALNQNMELLSVYEYYYLDNNTKTSIKNQKSHWIAEIQSKCENFSYEIKKISYTKYNETIVLLSISDDPSADNEITVDGSFMYHYDHYNGKAIYGEKQMLTISCPSMFDTLKWISTIDNNLVVKNSIVNDDTLKLKNTVRIYDDYGLINDYMEFSENNYGLWNSIIDTFFQAVSDFESDDIILKNLTRHISREKDDKYHDKSQDIIRRVIKAKCSCRMQSLSSKNNKLYADWNINEL